jgi:hypothetical protein
MASFAEMSRPSLLSILGCLALLFASGCHAQIGPTFGHTFGKGFSGGIEAGGGLGGVVKANVGGLLRSTGDKRTENIKYIVFEPPGFTLGAGQSNISGWGFVGGFWGGWFQDIYGPRTRLADFTQRIDCPSEKPDAHWLFLSRAIGLRYIGGAWEIYGTPKFGIRTCFEFSS